MFRKIFESTDAPNETVASRVGKAQPELPGAIIQDEMLNHKKITRPHLERLALEIKSRETRRLKYVPGVDHPKKW
jgi:hypothetical protein